MGLVNEKELGEAIASNLAPKLAEAQGRLEGFLLRLAEGHALKVSVPLGDRTVTVMVELVPKP
jgi:hypothetical protein